jgi:type IV pilus assembly protein PilE
MARGFESRASQLGVTLLELLTVVVIVAVLAGLSVSSYRRYIVRSNRTEAKSALLRVQVAQEKYFLQNRTYVLATADLASKLGVAVTTQSGMYAITLSNPGGTTNDYQATATAQGAQATSDTACATLTIDNTGARTPGDATGCWK